MTPREQLDVFMAKYDPAIQKLGRGALRRLRKLVPGATQLVYAYNHALVISFAPGEKGYEGQVSIGLYASRVNLFFLAGTTLPDPEGLLEGNGKTVRHIVLTADSLIDSPAVRSMIQLAVKRSPVPYRTSGPSPLVIKSITGVKLPRARTGSAARKPPRRAAPKRTAPRRRA